ncbi:hypothetical protein GRI62_05935 [Erythrobacter arachoides]|uniref:Uncharacterized protein n=1 Tax=Aurantiacibacter arachoides TaxID=1850444 RepID=A0A845A1Y1_9SPHN|nr:hypothetical protein [Aurantiacibacter arachoides]MXO93146.1 hypothetical protein [Aurantiacibacter arachoides]GGD51685.1 hypothetical protein GCM10011411_09390 [Aurantiacibacter arachoides]
MPYEPSGGYRIDHDRNQREHRERLYWLTLASGVINAVMVPLHLAELETAFVGPLIGGVIGSLLVAGMKGSTDGYFRSLVDTGLSWMAFGLGLAMLLLWIDSNTSLMDRLVPGFDRLAGNSLLLALVLGLLFHAGYAFAYMRDRLPFGGDDVAQ